MSPYNSTRGYTQKETYSILTHSTYKVMSDMMTNPVARPPSTSISHPAGLRNQSQCYPKQSSPEFLTAMASLLMKATSTFITVIHLSPQIKIPRSTVPMGQLIAGCAAARENNSETTWYDGGAKDFVSITIQDGISTIHCNEGFVPGNYYPGNLFRCTIHDQHRSR